MKLPIPPFIADHPQSAKLRACRSYITFRSLVWESQNKDDVDFRARTKDGEQFTQPHFEPRPILHFKDTWHCTDLQEAKNIARYLLRLPEVRELSLKGKTIWVQFSEDQTKKTKSSVLPGQKGDGNDLHVKAPE